MSTETKYYCDFKGCRKDIEKGDNFLVIYPFKLDRVEYDLCPEHAKYIFELFEKESK